MGGTTQFVYDARTLAKIQETAPNGGETTWQHDARGNVSQVALPSGLTIELASTELNQPSVIETSLGQVWQFQYDEHGQLLSRRDPSGAVTRYGYQHGLLAVMQGPDGRRTELGYDAQRLVTSVKLPNGGEMQLRHDRRGQLIKERDPRGAATQYTRDLVGRVTEAHMPTGLWQRFWYDAEDNLIEAQDPTRHVRLRYGHYHRVVEREEAETTLRFVYDTEDQLTAIENEAGERYIFELDARGLARRETGFDGRTRSYLRNAAGDVTQTFLPSGRTTDYAYDPAGRLTDVKHADGSFTKLTWREDGALLAAENESGAVQFELDMLGRVLRESRGEHAVESRYGAGGQRELLRTSQGAFLQTLPDALGLPAELRYGFAPSDVVQSRSELRIQRDLAGLESARQLAGGVTVSWERDLLGRPLTRRTLRTLPGAGVVETGASAYKWRGEDQIAAIIDAQSGPRVFEHDRRGRLVREARPDAVVERAMDAVGNLYRTRDGSDRRHQKGGVLEQDGATRYEHDEDGNRTAKIEPDGKAWRYHWNGAGMLREVERPDGSRVRYQYDALARRTQKQRVSLAEGGSDTIAAQTDFVWDGHTLVHELDHELGPTTWVWEPGTFTPVADRQYERYFRPASGLPIPPTANSGPPRGGQAAGPTKPAKIQWARMTLARLGPQNVRRRRAQRESRWLSRLPERALRPVLPVRRLLVFRGPKRRRSRAGF
jgi:YD repeat-containing protein